MALRDTLERWIVGDAGPAMAAGDDAPRTPGALELARMGEAADAIREHLAAQDRERRDILQLLSTLPEPLSALPRIASQQDRLGETLAQALLQARQRDATIDATLSRIVDGLTQQTEVAGLIQQQLDLNLQAANGVAEGTTRLTEAVTELATSSRQSTEFLSSLLDQSRAFAEDRARSQRQTRGLLFAAVGLSLASTALAIIAAILALVTSR